MTLYNPLIPYCDRILHPLSAGTLIRITGTANPSARCFAVNLQCGPSVNPRDDIALHLSPVFTSPPRVVRNSLQTQRWGPEESFGGFPLAGGQPFEMMVLLSSDHFMIAINGSHFCEFRYRLPMQRISHLAIDGDVAIASITFEASNRPTYAAPTAPVEALPPYPMGGSSHQTMPGMYAPPAPGYSSAPAYATGAAYASAPAYATGSPYPSHPTGYNAPTYPSGGYPQTSYPNPTPGYPTAGYPNPTPGYPNTGYPSTQYPHSPQSQNKGILGGLGGTLGGLAAGAAATSIGSAILGRSGHGMGHQKHHKSSPIPIAGLAAGAGAAALGAAVLTGHHPFKKAKKMFKHKGFKHKWHKPKFGKWKHKGWSSGSSSD